MNGIWETIKFFFASHKVASIAVAGVVGASAVGAGGYGIYNLVTEETPAEAVEVVDDYQAEDVYIPEFKNVVISSESLEKDLTVYISDENDNPVAGVPFSVKLLTKEAAEGLQSYVDAIKDLDNQIAEYTADYPELEMAKPEESEDAEGTEEASEDSKETADNADDQESGEHESIDVSQLPSTSDKITKILQDRNVDVTVTDEDGNVIETQHGDISSDPLYKLYLDKETALQSYAVALKEAEGTVYTDDDEDGVISEKDMEPGQYVLCLLNDIDSEVSYEPTNYSTEAEVKDKVEFKVQKEITKQIKKDVASEDGQKKEKVPVEATLKDTVEFVPSSKVENGGVAKSTTEVVAPKITAKASKATLKTDKSGLTKKHTIKEEVQTFVITYYRQLQNAKGENVGEAKLLKEESLAKGATPTFKPNEPEHTEGGVTYKLVTSPTYESVSAAKSYTFIYKEEKKEEPKQETTPETKPSEEKKDETKTEEPKQDEQKQEEQTTEKTEEPKTEEPVVEETKPADPAPETKEGAYRARGGVAVSFSVKDKLLAARIRRIIAANASTGVKEETATVDITYKEGVFTINATAGAISKLTVNGAEVAIKDSKTATFAATKDGDYAFVATPSWSDKVPATDAELLKATFTVSGFGTATTEQLKDKAGNLLFLDEGLTKPATAADYAAGKTYYYKSATYTYYGWQNIDGNTYYFDKNGNRVTGVQVIQGVQYDFGSDGVLIVKGTGIDVSKYQGNIDWKAAKSAVNFAIIRCGYRGMYDGQLHEDPYFYKNMAGAKAAGVNVGVYIYSTALNEAEAVQEASMAVAMAGKAGGCSYPVYLDMEDTVRGQSKLSTEQRMAIVNAFCSTVQASGHKAGLYCSKNWMTARMNAGAIPGSCSIWIAQYNTSCTYSGRKNMWQYSSKGSVPGIKGHVDMNKSF